MIPSADLFVGQSRARKLLESYLRKERVCGTFLLLGEPGLGKTTLATVFARAIVCERNKLGPRLWFCGQCYACRTIAAGDQPEFVVIRPSGQDIKVDQIDEDHGGLAAASLHPTLLSHRIYIFDDAQCLNLTTGNQLLKLLEEGPARTIFIFVSDKPDLMLPTIVSRSNSVRLTALPQEELAEVLGTPVGTGPALSAVGTPPVASANLPSTELLGSTSLAGGTGPAPTADAAGGVATSEVAAMAARMGAGRYVEARRLLDSPQWREAITRLAGALLERRDTATLAKKAAEFEFAALWAKQAADLGITTTEADKQVAAARRNELQRQALIAAYDRAAWWLMQSRRPSLRLGPELARLKQRLNQNVDPLLSQVAFENAL